MIVGCSLAPPHLAEAKYLPKAGLSPEHFRLSLLPRADRGVVSRKHGDRHHLLQTLREVWPLPPSEFLVECCTVRGASVCSAIHSEVCMCFQKTFICSLQSWRGGIVLPRSRKWTDRLSVGIEEITIGMYFLQLS